MSKDDCVPSETLTLDSEEAVRERIRLIQARREREQRQQDHAAAMQGYYRLERGKALVDFRWSAEKMRLIEQLSYDEDWDGKEPPDEYIYAFRHAVGAERYEAASFLRKVADEGLPCFHSIPPETRVLLFWLADMIDDGKHTR